MYIVATYMKDWHEKYNMFVDFIEKFDTLSV